jgi:hypothetical protein
MAEMCFVVLSLIDSDRRYLSTFLEKFTHSLLRDICWEATNPHGATALWLGMFRWSTTVAVLPNPVRC